MASTTSVVLVTVAMLLILLQRWVVQRRNYAMETVNRPEILRMRGWQTWAFPTFAWGMMTIANLPLAIIVYTSFLETSGPVFLQSFSLDSYRQVFHLVRGAIVNSFTFSAVALALIVIAGSIIGYIISRRDTGLTKLLDTGLMIPYVIPGTVLGIGFITAFNQPPIWITGTAAIIVLAYFIRRLPYMVRACASFVYQIDRSVEEASINLGAPPAQDLPQDHAAADGARHHGRGRPLLGRGDQRALRHRRPLHRPDLDHADRHLQPGAGRRLRPGSGRGLAPHPGDDPIPRRLHPHRRQRRPVDGLGNAGQQWVVRTVALVEVEDLIALRHVPRASDEVAGSAVAARAGVEAVTSRRTAGSVTRFAPLASSRFGWGSRRQACKPGPQAQVARLSSPWMPPQEPLRQGRLASTPTAISSIAAAKAAKTTAKTANSVVGTSQAARLRSKAALPWSCRPPWSSRVMK
jgi:hypothetical protein